MIEREMEDLIASYPDDFFPDRGFELRGRQESFAGVGRFDLLFEDRFKTKILMELKAVPAKYEVANQLAKYKDELQHRGENHIVMWLVAPQITSSVREFLDRIGIEYSEIHVAEFRRVAQRYGLSIGSEVPKQEPAVSQAESNPSVVSSAEERAPRARTQVETGPRVTVHSTLQWKASLYDLILTNPSSFEASKFISLVDAFQRAVPSRKNASLINELKRWATNPSYSHWPHKSNASLLRWVTTSSYKSAVPAAAAVWKYLFGEPTPEWYVWNQSSRSYEFDEGAWKIWFDSTAQIDQGKP